MSARSNAKSQLPATTDENPGAAAKVLSQIIERGSRVQGPAIKAYVDRLRQGSPEFVKWWEAHEIRSTASGLKTMSHPTLGVLHFEHTSFQANDDPALKLVIYTPV